MGLTDKQIRFCEEYLIDLNATQAAIRAGYSQKTAHSIGAENLIKPEIQAEIQKKQKELSERTGITAERVLQELADIGFHNIKDFVNGNNSILELKYLDERKTAAVSKVKTTITSKTVMEGGQPKAVTEATTEIALHNKISALELIGKHIGLFERDNKQKASITNITGMRVE